MTRGGRIALGFFGTLGVVVLLLVGALLVLTQTEWGRERVRVFALGQLEGVVDGEVSIGRLEGNLLRGLRLVDVRIVDAQERPFLAADTLATRYSLWGLLRQRIVLRDMRFVNAEIVLDQPPGEEWNWVRIFPTDPEPELIEPERPGWGDWLELRGVTLVESRITVRTEWEPEEDLTPAEQEEALRVALSEDSREWVVAVPGGHQNVMQFRELNAELPYVRPAHPDSTWIPVEVARFSGILQPFRPPVARVLDMAGSFRFGQDSLLFRDVRATLPGSRVTAEGVYAMDSGDLVLQLHGSPLALADLRFLYPPLPEEGGGSLRLALNMRTLVTHVVVRDMDLRLGQGTLAGQLDVMWGDTLRIQDTDLRFEGIDTRLVQRIAPDVEIPRHGEVSGRAVLAGQPEALRVDADVTFADYAAGTSRVRAAGEVGFAEEVRFGDFRVELLPLQAALVRAFAPEAPLRGVIEGYAELTGPLGGPLRLDSDLVLRDPVTGVSRVLAEGGVDMRDELRLSNLLVRLEPLRLDLLRDQVPEVPPGATLAGRMLLDGVPARALRLEGDLALTDPASGVSRVSARGGVAFDELRFQDLQIDLDPLRLDLVRRQVPELPAGATLAGRVRLDGAPERMLAVSAELALNDPRTGVSRLAAQGGVAVGEVITLRDMTLRAEPVQLELARPWVEDLPAGATLEGRAWVDGVLERRLQVDADLAVRDPASGLSRVAAVGGIGMGEELSLHDLRVRLDPVQVDLLRAQLPDLPPGGTLVGAMRLDGVPARMLQVAGEVTHADPRLGVSRIGVDGGIGMEEEGLRFAGLDLRFSPLRLELVRAFAPEQPLGGALQGTARLDGSPAGRLAFQADLEHRQAGEFSHVTGSGEVVAGPRGRAAVDLRLQPLSLVTVGRFAPEAGLLGSVRGELAAQGDLADLGIRADLVFADGGELEGRGRLDLASEEPGYDVDLAMRGFNLAAITARAPAPTLLTGTAAARGRGSDPETMNATLAADLRDSAVDDVAADLVRVRVALADGLATVDQSLVRIGGAEAAADGSFGLVATRSGELRYRVQVDSLHAFAAWLPGADTAVAAPGDGLDADARDPLAGDVADAPLGAPGEPAPGAPTATAPEPQVERIAGVTRVQYPGAPRPRAPELVGLTPGAGEVLPDPSLERDPEDPLAADAAAQPTAAPPEVPRPGDLPADSLAGSLRAQGTLRGNVERFDASGDLEVEELVVAGNAVASGRAQYTLRDFGTEQLDVELDADAREIRAAGMAFDSLATRVVYRGEREGTGRATLELFQDPETDLRLDSEFSLSLQRNELRLADLDLRFDTIHWRSTQPSVIGWGEAGVDVEGLELRSNLGGRIFADGRLPLEGTGDLRLEITDLEIAQILALAQTEVDATGRFSLAATVQGTQENPLLQGQLSLLGAVADARPLPDLQGTFAYEDQELTASAQLVQNAQIMATAEARLPIDLALTGDVQQRLLDRPLAIDVRADSLALDALPAFSEDIEELQGRIVGNVAVRGTFSDPVLDGLIDLDLGAFHLVPVGVRFQDIAGTLRLQNDVLVLDSLVAWSDGPIRMTGTVALPELTQPVLDLEVEAREAWIIDTEDARLQVDADLEVTGPLDGMALTGEVRTRRGVIYIPEAAELGTGELVNLEDPGTFARMDTLFAAERALLALESTLLDNLQMDLAVVIDRDVWLRSIEANIEIYTPAEVGPLRVQMNGGLPTLALTGTVNADRGDYEFMGRRFRLTRGAVTFVGEPEFNPLIQVVAEHEVRLPGREAFEIRVVLSGTMLDLNVALESSAQPPISQTDLMSYLAFGREASSLLQMQGSALSGQGSAGGGLVGNVAAMATQQLAAVALDQVVRDLEREAARNFGLDVIRITPADLPPEVFTGSYLDVLRGTEVEAGRYLGPRLFIAGQARPTFVQPGARAEYRTEQGFIWTFSWQPRFLPSEPTLEQREAVTGSILGSFLFREWRF